MSVSRILCSCMLTLAVAVVASAGQSPAAPREARTRTVEELLTMPRPIDAVDSVWIEELTYLEVRDAVKAGKTTVIVATGGVEQNGPYLVTGKHNYLNRVFCETIARKLGNALCAPNVPFVPGGDLEPPTDMMRFPGTISVTESTFRALLTDIARSLKAHGFQNIILIGDSGDNQAGMKQVAQELSERWANGTTRIHFVAEFYDYPAARVWSNAKFGWQEVSDGFHDSALSSSMLFAVNPDLARIRQRIAANQTTINGVSLMPIERAIDWGRQAIQFRSDIAVAAIEAAISRSSPSPP